MEGGRATYSDKAKALSLNYVCWNPAVALWSTDFGHLCDPLCEWLCVSIWIEDVKMMGFYSSAETAQWKSAAVCLLPLEEYWLRRCMYIWAKFCILHGTVSHLWITWIICWDRNIKVKPNPNIPFGRIILFCSWKALFSTWCTVNICPALRNRHCHEIPGDHQ